MVYFVHLSIFCFAGQTSCSSQCPSGFACPARNSTEECVAGTYSALGDPSCQACASGYYASSVRM